jgi:hypothetical protein
MRASRVAAPLFCFALVACATTPSAPAPTAPPPNWKLATVSPSTGSQFQGTVNGGQLSLTISGRSISGPVTSLDVSGGHVRGTGSSGRSIDVSFKDNKAEGTVGSSPFSCIVTVEPDGSAHITGAMGAGNTDFILSPSQITGRIGVIKYQLAWDQPTDKYQGQMEPGGYGFLQLPVSMSYWTDTEFACTLALLLMGA